MFRPEPADRRILILAGRAAGAAQVRPLIPAAPGCAVLVTGEAAPVYLPPGVLRISVPSAPEGRERR